MKELPQVHYGLTIDGPKSKDLDDGFSLTKANGVWELRISIANVANHIMKGSPLDNQAYQRGETCYIPAKYEPMLPTDYSENKLSLLPSGEKDVITITLYINNDGSQYKDPTIRIGKFRNMARLTYAAIDRIIDGEEHSFKTMLTDAKELALQLLYNRRNNNAMIIYDLNHGWTSTETGHVKKLKEYQNNFGYIIIQEFMILANSIFACFCQKNNIPIIYRVHHVDSELSKFTLLIEQIQQAISEGRTNDLPQLQNHFHSMLKKATYQPQPDIHFGLQLQGYTHATSPIRRYADLIVQRQLIAYLLGEPYPYTMEHLLQICEHLNTLKLLGREEANLYFTFKKYQLVTELYAKANLVEVSPDEFRDIIDLAESSNAFNPEIYSACHARLKTHSLDQETMQILLFGKHNFDLSLQQEIVKAIITNQGATFALLHGTPFEKKLSVRSYVSNLNQAYTVSVIWKGKTYKTTGLDSNKRRAKFLAYAHLLCLITELEPPETLKCKEDKDMSNAKSSLNIWTQQNGTTATFEIVKQRGSSHAPEFLAKASVLTGKHQAEGEWKGSKKAAYESAAQKLLEELPTSFKENDVMGNPIGDVMHYIQTGVLSNSNITFDMVDGTFICTWNVSRDDVALTGKGKALQKKLAKKLAAQDLLNTIRS